MNVPIIINTWIQNNLIDLDEGFDDSPFPDIPINVYDWISIKTIQACILSLEVQEISEDFLLVDVEIMLRKLKVYSINLVENQYHYYTDKIYHFRVFRDSSVELYRTSTPKTV